MPTNHRELMVEQGYAEPHHGHDPVAVKHVKALEKADEELRVSILGVDSGEEAVAARQAEKRAARPPKVTKLTAKSSK